MSAVTLDAVPAADAAAARIAIVTGAADGIGWATAQRFAADGLLVALLDLDGRAAIRRAASLGPEHIGLVCDVSAEPAVELAITAVLARYGRIDVLVNNAGIGDQTVPTLEQDYAAFGRMLDVHLGGAFLMSRAVGRAMLAKGSGAIVNLSSIAGFGGIPGRNAYAAAKAGINGMTRSLACEWARHGVRVNAVAPGYVMTELVEKLRLGGSLDTALLAGRTPLGRLAQPHEIAAAIAFLASPQASFITGTTLHVDGGWLALGTPDSVLDSIKPASKSVHQ